MKDPLLKGHPLHAILSDLPVGTLVAGVACDAMGLVARRPEWRFAADVAHGAALLGGCAAGLVGLWDYQAVPGDHPVRAAGARHGLLNAAMLALLGASLLARRRARSRPDGRARPAAMALSGAALAVLGASGWLGGDLVFRYGWRVAPAEHAEQLEDALRARGEADLIDAAHATVRRYERTHALLP
jgi:uncharacterized membrane protein